MLDLNALSAEMGRVGEREVERRARAAEEADRAAECASGLDGERWSAAVVRVRGAKTPFLFAHSGPGDLPGAVWPAPALPPAHVVVAADGSQIAPDRHEGLSAACWLLNIGRIFIAYGSDVPRPRLESSAEVFALDDAGDGGDEDEAERRAARGLAARRFGREMAALAELAADAAATGLPSVALTDGSLIAWALFDETGDDPAKQEALAALREALNATKALRVPLAGYVSGPGSRDVVNALRIGVLCPKEPAECYQCPAAPDELPCATIRRSTDAQLFGRILKPGERSAVFSAAGQQAGYSHVLKEVYGPDHWIAFFYCHVGAEIVRIEVPAWVAADETLLNRVHAVCLDQANKGRGYPVALAEAHESAVVRAADRDLFLNLLRKHLVRAGSPGGRTRKALAKQARSV